MLSSSCHARDDTGRFRTGGELTEPTDREAWSAHDGPREQKPPYASPYRAGSSRSWLPFDAVVLALVVSVRAGAGRLVGWLVGQLVVVLRDSVSQLVGENRGAWGVRVGDPGADPRGSKLSCSAERDSPSSRMGRPSASLAAPGNWTSGPAGRCELIDYQAAKHSPAWSSSVNRAMVPAASASAKHRSSLAHTSDAVLANYVFFAAWVGGPAFVSPRETATASSVV